MYNVSPLVDEPQDDFTPTVQTNTRNVDDLLLVEEEEQGEQQNWDNMRNSQPQLSLHIDE